MSEEEEQRILDHPLTKDRGQKWLRPTADGELRRDINPSMLDRERDIARRLIREVILIYEGYPAVLFFDDLDDVLQELMMWDKDQLEAVPKAEDAGG